MENCIICNSNNPPYKCPKCKIKYCKIQCYKQHQNVGCEIIPTQTPEATSSNYNYITDNTVLPETLKLLENSGELKEILKNPHVRNILLEIDTSKDPADILDRAMKEPIFVEFADACLKAIDENK